MEEDHSTISGWLDKFNSSLRLNPKPPKNIQQLLFLISQAEKNLILPVDVFNMIKGVLNVSEMRVSDVMIPRSQMVYLDLNQSPTQNLENIIKSRHSRFPVVDKSKDKVAGVLLAKDILLWLMENKSNKIKLNKFLRKATFVPENKRLNVILREFRANRSHLAIVVDEYGNTSGIVTIEDVLEQIVGDISDEHDFEESKTIFSHSPVRHTVKAQTNLEDFNDYFRSNLHLKDVRTIGGFVVNTLGQLPKRNDVLKVDKFSFKVLRTDKTRIHLLQVNLDSSLEESSSDKE